MDGMISTGRFSEFVSEFIKTINEEQEQDINWQYFLHKVWEGSYSDFVDDMKNNRENQNMTETAKESAVQHSMKILNNFNPERGETK